jgi:hypothetical protein
VLPLTAGIRDSAEQLNRGKSPIKCYMNPGGGYGAGCAHAVLVNSRFTAAVFGATFTRLHAAGVRPAVLHPAVDVAAFAAVPPPPPPGAARVRSTANRDG